MANTTTDISLDDLVNKHFRQGTDRATSLQATFERIQPFFKDMGITRIANVTHLDNVGLPVVTVCRPLSKAVSVAQGKGQSLLAAKVSGSMEAIETFHGEHIDAPLRYSTFRELKSSITTTDECIVDVTRLPKLSVSQYHDDFAMLWILGRDLINNKATWVPFECVHCDYSLPLPTGSGCFMMSTNGLASGNHILEAISHGLSEVIERDATSIWQLSNPFLPQNNLAKHIDIATIDDPECRTFIDMFQQAGLAVGIWNITSDTNIPTFYCVIMNQTFDGLRPLYPASGVGTHVDKCIALSRAMTEAAQTRLTQISGSRDDVTMHEYQHGQDQAFQTRVLKNILIDGQKQDFSRIPQQRFDSFNEDISYQISQLQAVGIEQVIAVNLTKSLFDIPVVRVIVPGLEGIQDVPGYVPGQRAQAAQHKQQQANRENSHG